MNIVNTPLIGFDNMFKRHGIVGVVIGLGSLSSFLGLLWLLYDVLNNARLI